MIWKTGAKFQVFFQFSNLLQSVTNHTKFFISVFYFFEKVNEGQLKMVSVNY